MAENRQGWHLASFPPLRELGMLYFVRLHLQDQQCELLTAIEKRTHVVCLNLLHCVAVVSLKLLAK